jgi:hypothetical protein
MVCLVGLYRALGRLVAIIPPSENGKEILNVPQCSDQPATNFNSLMFENDIALLSWIGHGGYSTGESRYTS